MIEHNFITSMIKAEGNLLAFFERPIAAVLGIVTFLVWGCTLWRALGPPARQGVAEAARAGAGKS
jgi:TctA family transporter